MKLNIDFFLFQIDKDRVANIIAAALQKQANGEGDNETQGQDLHGSRPVSQTESLSRPNSIHDTLPGLPPRQIKDPR